MKVRVTKAVVLLILVVGLVFGSQAVADAGNPQCAFLASLQICVDDSTCCPIPGQCVKICKVTSTETCTCEDI